jgi:phage terminase large subunit GpA-like protein
MWRGRPAHQLKAYIVCPNCGCAIDESHKSSMVEAGEWRVTAPEVEGHAGFRLNSLISMFRNERWGILAKKFLEAKNNPFRMMVFENSTLGKCSKQSIDNIDPLSLQAKTENFGPNNLPPEVLMISSGVDVQNDRLEVCFLGWSSVWQPFVLGYVVIHGSTIEQKTWSELDKLLATKWRHPHGYDLPVEATAVDYGGTGSGSESRPQAVLNFTNPRMHRHIYAVKGVGGPSRRPLWVQSFSKKAHRGIMWVHSLVCMEGIVDNTGAFRGLTERENLSRFGHGKIALQNVIARRLSHSRVSHLRADQTA